MYIFLPYYDRLQWNWINVIFLSFWKYFILLLVLTQVKQDFHYSIGTINFLNMIGRLKMQYNNVFGCFFPPFRSCTLIIMLLSLSYALSLFTLFQKLFIIRQKVTIRCVRVLMEEFHETLFIGNSNVSSFTQCRVYFKFLFSLSMPLSFDN